MAGGVSVLLVEDVDEMRELMEALVNEMSGVWLLGAAKSIPEARYLISKNRPDLVLLDEILPGESSGDLLEELVQSGIPVLVMTSMENPLHLLPPGALARVQKPSWDNFKAASQLIRAQIISALGRSDA